MRVLLVNPKSKLPIDTRVSPSLGLAYLAAVSERRGDEVRIHDGDMEDVPVAGGRRQFKPASGRHHGEHDPGHVGLEGSGAHQGSRLASADRAGWAAPDRICHTNRPAPPEIDLVARGEGEATWEELSERMAAGRDWRGVAGLTYRHDGQIVDEPDRAALDLSTPATAGLSPLQHGTLHQPAAD